MFRICLFALLIAATAPAGAREVKLSSPNSGSCPETAAATSTKDEPAPARATRARPAQAETRAKPTVHSDAPGPGRLQSPRWHSFLPGMVR